MEPVQVLLPLPQIAPILVQNKTNEQLLIQTIRNIIRKNFALDMPLPANLPYLENQFSLNTYSPFMMRIITAAWWIAQDLPMPKYIIQNQYFLMLVFEIYKGNFIQNGEGGTILAYDIYEAALIAIVQFLVTHPNEFTRLNEDYLKDTMGNKLPTEYHSKGQILFHIDGNEQNYFLDNAKIPFSKWQVSSVQGLFDNSVILWLMNYVYKDNNFAARNIELNNRWHLLQPKLMLIFGDNMIPNNISATTPGIINPLLLNIDINTLKKRINSIIKNVFINTKEKTQEILLYPQYNFSMNDDELRHFRMRLLTAAWWLLQDQSIRPIPAIVINHQYFLMTIFYCNGKITQNGISTVLTGYNVYEIALAAVMRYLAQHPAVYNQMNLAYTAVGEWKLPSNDSSCCGYIETNLQKDILQNARFSIEEKYIGILRNIGDIEIIDDVLRLFHVTIGMLENTFSNPDERLNSLNKYWQDIRKELLIQIIPNINESKNAEEIHPCLGKPDSIDNIEITYQDEKNNLVSFFRPGNNNPILCVKHKNIIKHAINNPEYRQSKIYINKESNNDYPIAYYIEYFISAKYNYMCIYKSDFDKLIVNGTKFPIYVDLVNPDERNNLWMYKSPIAVEKSKIYLNNSDNIIIYHLMVHQNDACQIM